MGGGGTTTSEQEISLSPEAQQLMSQELALFGKNFLPAEMGARNDALTGLGPLFAKTAGARGTGNALNLAKQATATAGADAKLATPAMTGVMRDMDTTKPEAMNNLQNVFRQMAMSKGSLVDPRFAQFLRPDVNSTSEFEPSTGSKAVQGVGMGLAAAAVVVGLIAI